MGQDSSQQRQQSSHSRRSTARSRVNFDSDGFFIHGKIPPQALDLEEAVIGSAMLESSAVESALRILTPESFYKESHQVIFRALRSLYDKNLPTDLLAVMEELRHTENLELAGGPYGLTMLTDRIASTANIEYHCLILKQKYQQREVIRIAQQALNICYDEGSEPDAALDYLDKSIQDVNELTASGGSMRHISHAVIKSRESLAKREKMAKEGKISGVPTGLKDLDFITKGWQGGDMIVVASRPGMGKTSVMLHLAKSAARAGVPVCIYSLEMQDVSLSNRLILSECNIDVDRFASGFVSEYDWLEFEKAEIALKKLPIYVDDNPVVNTRYVKNHSRVMKKKGLCGMILVDYLQLTDMRTDQDNRNREQEVATASREFKIIAKSLDVPLILLAQLNRSVETRGGIKRPMLSDLRESGAIEQDADSVIFIYRPMYYKIETDEKGDSTLGLGELIIEKNRNGRTGDVAFRHNDSLTQIWDYDRESAPAFNAGAFVNNILQAESSAIPPNENFYSALPELPF